MWVDRLREQEPSAMAARIGWYQRRHHCYDLQGEAMTAPTKTDQYWEKLMRDADPGKVLDEVVRLWNAADEHAAEAELLGTEADNQQKMADELYDKAEDLWKPLLDEHPEWRDALIEGEDPRG